MAGAAFFRPRVVSACADCMADLELVEDATNVLVLWVRHDDTCPALKRREESA